MADSGEASHERKVVLRVERYRHKQVPYFEDKSKADAYVELRFDIRGLVLRECSAEFESWKKVPEELKKSMLGELSWKFDVLQDVERGAAAPKEKDCS
ncbi:hypothetical protein D8674_028364 [Pyrus ussuriensis x Pyrus communis]|uniref:Uncharacterized protein n=1 Tax=Pyrus ussuriensis x Pyrus communis TaxID=2448454 RepID=A0A5N5HZ19_9ROSA|nr:hypothetical protein D8674_028364 [Pyrus ussuriensis x Pyrus communis]